MVSRYPLKKNTANQRIVFPILDADGDLVTAAADLDSEYSLDGAQFVDMTDEAHEIATSSGMYYLDPAQAETNGDVLAIIVKTSTSGAKTTALVFYTAAQTMDETDAIVDDIHTDVGTAITNIGDIHTTDLPDLHTDVADVHTDIAHIHDTDLPDLHTDVGDIHTDVGTVDTVVDNVLRIGKNRWKVDGVANTLTIYADDGTTPLYVLNLLDSAGNPAHEDVYERVP